VAQGALAMTFQRNFKSSLLVLEEAETKPRERSAIMSLTIDG
jgi:hypothetical protein